MSVKRDFYEQHGEMIETNVDDEIHNICYDLYKGKEYDKHLKKMLKDQKLRDKIKTDLMKELGYE